MVDLAFGSFQDRMTLEGSTVKKFVAWPCTTANIKAPNVQQITSIQCSKCKKNLTQNSIHFGHFLVFKPIMKIIKF